MSAALELPSEEPLARVQLSLAAQKPVKLYNKPAFSVIAHS